jgi:hypothetical protein
MNTYDRFQYLREDIDSQNILDSLMDFLSDSDMEEFCNYLEDEFNIEYNNNDYDEY